MCIAPSKWMSLDLSVKLEKSGNLLETMTVRMRPYVLILAHHHVQEHFSITDSYSVEFVELLVKSMTTNGSNASVFLSF